VAPCDWLVVISVIVSVRFRLLADRGVVVGEHGGIAPVSTQGEQRSTKCSRYQLNITKNPHFQTMPECAKAHLQQSRISKIFWGRSWTPLSVEGKEIGKGIREGKGGGKLGLERGEGKGKREGREE